MNPTRTTRAHGDAAPDAHRHEQAKRRALRAARAVTISLAALAASGCSSLVGPLEPDAPTEMADAAADANVAETAPADAAPDAPLPTPDVADAGTPCSNDGGWEEYSRCCEANGWNWDLGCAAWGPFVPPDMPAAEV